MGFNCGCLETVLGYVSIIATKEAQVVIESTLTFLGHQFTVFPSFDERSEMDSFGAEVLPCVEPEFFFYFDNEFLPDLLSESDLDLDLFWKIWKCRFLRKLLPFVPSIMLY